MSVLDGLRNKTGELALKKELAKQSRKVLVSNLQAAKKIGLLYHPTDEAIHKKVKRYVRYLKEEEGIREVKAFAFTAEKETPIFLNAKLDFDFFGIKDTKWNGRPSGSTVENFQDEEYDILIDLTEEPVIPLRFVLVHSRARFKVGRSAPENEPYYDLMIDAKDGDLDQFVKQINHYLKIINNGDGK